MMGTGVLRFYCCTAWGDTLGLVEGTALSVAYMGLSAAREARGAAGGGARHSLEGMRALSASSRGAGWAMERESVVSISTELGDSPQDARISAFETNPPPDTCQGAPPCTSNSESQNREPLKR